MLLNAVQPHTSKSLHRLVAPQKITERKPLALLDNDFVSFRQRNNVNVALRALELTNARTPGFLYITRNKIKT